MAALKSVKLFVLLAAVPATFAINIKPRSAWGAAAGDPPKRMSGKADYVLIHHSDQTSSCSNAAQCRRVLKSIQADHKGSRGYGDIAYNFMLGGDGNIYEGRGFGVQGAHTPNYNHNSIGIVFIGNFRSNTPSSSMQQNALDLMEYAVQAGYLKNTYTVLGHRQTKSTTCPGNQLFNIIKKWPHWRNI